MNDQRGSASPYDCLMMTRTYLLSLLPLVVLPALVACQGVGGAASEPTPAVAPPLPSAAEAPTTDAKTSGVPSRDVASQPKTAAAQDQANSVRTRFEGTAQNAKLGAVLLAADGVRHWVELDAWPDKVLGKKIVLEATPVIRYDLPVVPSTGDGQSAGVPVESGQTADEAARREVLTAPTWKLAE